MNPRIEELYKETIGKDWAYDFDSAMAEKFAELIIDDCVKQCDIIRQYCIDNDPLGREIIGAEYSRKLIKEHFGVE